jgi:hypothetical protein
MPPFGQKPSGKNLHGRPNHKWQDGIKMDLREIGCEGEDWIQLVLKTFQWWACESSGFLRVGTLLAV